MTIHETAAKLSAVNARIAASALKSNADCIRMAARIHELEGALRKLHSAFDAPHSSYAGIGLAAQITRAILAKGN